MVKDGESERQAYRGREGRTERETGGQRVGHGWSDGSGRTES